MHLTFVYLSAILNFVFAIRSGTYKLLQRISFILFPIFIDKVGLALFSIWIAYIQKSKNPQGKPDLLNLYKTDDNFSKVFISFFFS